MPEGYIPIELESLVVDTPLGFNLFMERKSGTMVLYRNSETAFDEAVLRRLRDNRNDVLYVNEDQWENYQEYLQSNLAAIVADESVPIAKRCQMVYTTSTQIMQKVFEEERTAEAVKKARHVITPTVSMILSGDDAIRNMISLTSHDYYTYTHSVNVCVFSVSLTTKLFPDLSVEEFERLGSGFLLHDIGKREVAREIINKDGPLTAEEWNEMRRHPELGHKALQDTEASTEEGSVIVLQHHERYDGTGYPNKLQGDDIHVWAKICCISDAFDALTTQRSYRQPASSFEALQLMQKEMVQNFDQEFFREFVTLFAFHNA